MIHRLMRIDSPFYVSCLSRPDYFDSKISNTKAFLGLHLYLTDFPLHCFGLKRPSIKREFNRQLETFCEKVGKKPDYIDGHRHIQEYYPIRLAIQSICRKHGIPLRRSLASTKAMMALKEHNFWRSYVKNSAFKFLCGATNSSSFNGPIASHYSFNEKAAFELLLTRFLETESAESFILHPGPTGWKKREYECFLSLNKD